MHNVYKYYSVEPAEGTRRQAEIIYGTTNGFEDLTESDLVDALKRKAVYSEKKLVRLFTDKEHLRTHVEKYWHDRGYKNYTMGDLINEA